MSDDVRVPDGITPIRAWRLWKIEPDGTLCSPQQDLRWRKGWQTASCAGWRVTHGGRQPHQAPADCCHCGFYGLNEPHLAVSRGWMAAATAVLWRMSWTCRGCTTARACRGCTTAVGTNWMNRLPDLVLGVAEFAGRCVEHQQGWRAQRARIAGLVVDPDWDAIIREACASYDAQRITLADRKVFSAALELWDRRKDTWTSVLQPEESSSSSHSRGMTWVDLTTATAQ